MSAGAIFLFGVSAILVGAIGSTKLWGAQFGGPPMAFARVAPVIFVAELLAYFAVMLTQSGGLSSTGQVFAGVGLAVCLRGAQSCLAAVIGSPHEAEGFRYAFAHYYASYYPGVLLQIAVSSLFLWLVKGAFEARPVVLTPPRPEASEAEAEPEPEPDDLEGTPERRQQLIEQLMRPAEAEEAEEVAELEQVAQPPEAEEPAKAEEPQPADDAVQHEPPTLTPQQSVLLALREDDDEQAPPVPETLALLEPEPEPEAPEAEPPPTVGAQALATALSIITASVGAGHAFVGRSPAGHTLALAAQGLSDPESALAPCEALMEAAMRLCEQCDLGRLRRAFMRLAGVMRLAGGYVAGTAILRDDRGLYVTIALPGEANLGVADLALGKLESVAAELELPEWSPCSRLELTPAYPDADLRDRISPLFEWVPEAAGLVPTVASAGGRQVVTLSRGAPASLSAAAALANAHAAAEALCAALRLQPCDLMLLSGDRGAAACAEADLAGQHILVALIQPGSPSPSPANIQLRQILNGLSRLAEGGPPDAT